MEQAVCFIVIFCGILSQGICNVHQANNAEISSDLLIRQKRIVGGSGDLLPNVPYLVTVLKNRNRHCIATLLTADVAVTSATCFINQNTQNMRIESHSIAGNQLHQIVQIIYYNPNFSPAHLIFKNLALVRFAHPISFHTSHNRPIPIFSEILTSDNMPTFVIGWGRPATTRGRSNPPETLRFLSMMLISIEYCHYLYRNMIEAENICAVAALPLEYCENKDTGAPLVKNNQLLGIYVYRDCSRVSNPNVFMNFLNHDIRRWIHEHVPSLGLF